MSFNSGVSQLVSESGKDILSNPKLPAILDDYQAFQSFEDRTLKPILIQLVKSNAIIPFLELGEWNAKAEKMISSTAQSLNLDEDKVEIIFKGIGTALGWKCEKTKRTTKPTTKKKSEDAYDINSRKPTNNAATQGAAKKKNRYLGCSVIIILCVLYGISKFNFNLLRKITSTSISLIELMDSAILKDSGDSEDMSSESEDEVNIDEIRKKFEPFYKTISSWGTPSEYVERCGNITENNYESYQEEAYEKYDKVSDAAYDTYNEISDKMYATYDEIRNEEYEKYEKIRDEGYEKYHANIIKYEEYDKIRSEAYKTYDSAQSKAYHAYDFARSAAYEEYDAILSTSYDWYYNVQSQLYDKRYDY